MKKVGSFCVQMHIYYNYTSLQVRLKVFLFIYSTKKNHANIRYQVFLFFSLHVFSQDENCIKNFYKLRNTTRNMCT